MTEILNKSNLRGRRRDLRKRSTPQEKILWEELRNNKLEVKFRRQFSVGGYILDFCCARKRLGVEIDGPIHDTVGQKSYDKLRDKLTRELGFKIARFTNKEIENDLVIVVKKIRTLLLTKEKGKG